MPRRLASQRLVERGLPPLPHITPHTLRRTYASIMLLATGFDVKFVQSQVGHAKGKMTLDVYNQLPDRGKRQRRAAHRRPDHPVRPPDPAAGGEFNPPFSPPVAVEACEGLLASDRKPFICSHFLQWSQPGSNR
jgi:Phage integrase family